MSFQMMKESLRTAYERNVYNARMHHFVKDGFTIVSIGDKGPKTPERRRIPILSGLSGIGKTASIVEFAGDKGFELIKLDCSYMPSSMFASIMYDAIERIESGQIDGCVLLVDNIDQADSQWQELLVQYSDDHLDTVLDAKNEKVKTPGKAQKVRMSVNEVPETLFIVGEQRPV